MTEVRIPLSGGGSALSVEEEGSEVQSATTTLNFVGSSITAADAGSGEVTVTVSAGGGSVDTSGTPVANDFARFTDADTIEGRSYAETRASLNVEDGADVTDETNVTAALDGATLTDLGTPASTDRILLQDADDSGNLKTADFSEFGGGGGMSDLVDDTSPQLGGSLDVNGNIITSNTNGDIDLTPHGTGQIGANANLRVLAGKALSVFDGTNADSMAISHDGTDVNVACTNTTDISFTGITDMNIGGTAVSLTSHNHSGVYEPADASILKNIVEDVTPQLGAALDVNGFAITSASDGDVDITPNGTGQIGANANLRVLGGKALSVFDAGDTDSMSISHDGTDINIGCTNTADISITGITWLNVPALRVNGANLTSTLIGTWNNALQTVAVTDLDNGTDGELITWNSAGQSTTVAAGTSGQVLTSNGAGAEPTFQAAAGGSVDIITVYDGSPTQSFTTTVATVTLDTTSLNTNGSNFSLSGNQVTVADAGNYKISYHLKATLSGGTRDNCENFLERDPLGGGSFATIAGTETGVYGRIAGETASCALPPFALALTAGDIIRIRADMTGNTMTCEAATMTIEKIP